jgi:hypothetical protein
MRFLSRAKDGGPKSTVTGYWLFEIKRFLSVALLKFEDGSRDEYHSHAFDSVNWVLKGELHEKHLFRHTDLHGPSWLPVITRRETFHRVTSVGTTWVLAIRGPWSDHWQEYDPATDTFTVLENGRKVVSTT